jgi:ATP-binding cassette subfamily C protein LapB
MSELNYTPWLSAILIVAKHYRIEYSEENIRVNLAWDQGDSVENMVTLISRQVGLNHKFEKFSEKFLDPWRLPMIAEFNNGQVGVIERLDKLGNVAVQFSGEQGLSVLLQRQEVHQSIKRVLILRPEIAIQDARVDGYIAPYKKSWFWQIVLKDWKRYGDIMLASLIANILALSGMIFSMQVYDRVIPAQSIPTLWVLAGGVLLAFVFEFILRVSRIRISDIIGKRADLKVSDRVFGHALRIKNSERSKSTGTFISQIRELESVRELVTSTTIGAFADLPFFFLFLFVMWLVGGQLVFVVLIALPLILIPGLLIQRPLAKLSVDGMRESSIRNAMLVESVQAIEDIKLLRAEPRFQNQWNHYNEVSASISMKQRFLSGMLTTWTQQLQTLMYAAMVLAGSFLVMEGEMTTGALVACSIMTSRMLSPLSQIAGIMTRWQQAKVARTSLNELMSKPVDQEDHQRLVHRPLIQGHYELHNAIFKYVKEDPTPTLAIKNLKIKAGEKIAILGKNGAGKTSLLQLLSGMQTIESGSIKLDGIDLGLIDPADVRRDMSLLNQNAHLFFGTIRDNLTMGSPLIGDQEILQALTLTGALDFIQAKSEGLNHLIQEGGIGLSGGQRQSLLLTRTLIRQSNIILLDEPTAWLDEVSEKQLIGRLQQWMVGKTLIVATHRMAVLNLVDRIIVMNNGQVVMDGPKEQILQQTKTQEINTGAGK